jgi:orotidine-5'-phosphate decarboxylase
MNTETFGSRLATAMRERAQFCVGIDPHPSLLATWGLNDDVAGVERFALTVVEALADRVAILKPQSAFFERHGSGGIAVLERTIAEIRAAGGLTLLDVKRGDIGSTMQAYADAYADPGSPLCADAVTASPYLGFESLRPLLDMAAEHGNGVFVLAMTSNAEGREVQQARSEDGRTVTGTVLDQARIANRGAAQLGSVGVVVGATVGSTVGAIDEDFEIGGPILAPGFGAQGGDADDLSSIFGPAVSSVLPSSSRDILQAGPNVASLQVAAMSAVDSCRKALAR